MSSPDTERLDTERLDLAIGRLGIATTLVVGVPVLVDQVVGDGDGLVRDPLAWWAAYLLYVVVFVALVEDWPRPFTSRVHAVALGVMAVTGLVAVALSPSYGFAIILSIVTATATTFVFGFGPGMLLACGQGVVIMLVYLATAQVGTGEAILQGVAWTAFMAFGVFTVEAASREARARERLADLNDELATANARLARTNAQLEEAQRLLAVESRNAERLRISRDLHDLIGHQLTALTLQLEAAEHRGAGPASDNVVRAREIARDLLGDVREVVGRLREHAADAASATSADRGARSGRDVADQVRRAAAATRGLEVVVDLDESALPTDDTRGTAVVRAVQEAVTNTVRHADADRLWVRAAEDDGSLVLTVADDGRGAAELVPGNGLLGMRERVGALGGTVETGNRSGGGFLLRVVLPGRRDGRESRW